MASSTSPYVAPETGPPTKILPIQNAAKRLLKKKTKGLIKEYKKGNKEVKGKYAGKERYKGLTRNAPKGKYKGKYIGPDRFKGDAKAINEWRASKRKKRSTDSANALRKSMKRLPIKPVTPAPAGPPTASSDPTKAVAT
jgi:hypothetical protein